MDNKNVKMDFQNKHSEMDDLRAQLGREISKSDDLENAILKTQLEEMAKKIADLEKQLQTGNANAHSQRISKVLNKIDYKKIKADRKRGIKFSDDGTVLIEYPTTLTNKTYNIPDGVTEIGEEAFYGCENLSSIIIPDSVTKIGDEAFYGCENLSSIVIPDGVTEIGPGAFSGCKILSDIKIPNGVSEIAKSLFSYCESLSNIIIPENITYVDAEAFRNCTGLKTIQFLNNKIIFENDCCWDIFEDCSSLSGKTKAHLRSLGYKGRF